MTTAPPVAVTGSTGVVGGLVARHLADLGVSQRLLVRTPARAPRLSRSTVYGFSYSDRVAATEALTGVDVLFMVSASESAERLDQHRAFVDSAVDAGVRHVVYTSFIGAAPDATFTLARDHHVTEEYVKASGLDWTFLRDNFYLDFMEALVGDDAVIRGPAGDGCAAFVARADVARTAASILVDSSDHVGRTYHLTGPEALTLDAVAATLSRVSGRSVTFHEETVQEAYRSRSGYGAPDWQVDAWVSTYTAIAAGVMAEVSGDVEAITGVAPMSFEDYLQQNAP